MHTCIINYKEEISILKINIVITNTSGFDDNSSQVAMIIK